jgi:LPS export ABC transporter protein LptC
MINKKYIIPFFKSIVLILIGTVLFSCENDLAVVESLKVDEKTPVESSFDVTLEYTDSGKLVMTMKTPEINRFVNDDEFMEMPQGMNMEFYDSLGNVKSTISANYSINYVKKKIMKAENNVIATNSKGQKLITEELIWDQNTHKIYTEKNVKVISEDKTLFGDGLVSDEQFENWEISHPTGDITLDTDVSDTLN